MTYSKELYDKDLEKLQQDFLRGRSALTWDHHDAHALLDILKARLENFESYTAAPR